ncbi:hypothetical protein [Streptomyces sp. MBT62]|uniref:hypothetical protein n=1 Tax=Streptomyces sp. MBT62 TaxID=2800410 RepID=UPI0019097EDE|nr:hypothetical protein [Streptomyces sp. MBT62]MBK3569924.1 hypothetical protein [Streptomyces sp. MBT62]
MDGGPSAGGGLWPSMDVGFFAGDGARPTPGGGTRVAWPMADGGHSVAGWTRPAIDGGPSVGGGVRQSSDGGPSAGDGLWPSSDGGHPVGSATRPSPGGGHAVGSGIGRLIPPERRPSPRALPTASFCVHNHRNARSRSAAARPPSQSASAGAR